MRDGIHLAKQGVPAIALITTPFWQQAEFIARGDGMETLPRHCLPYPVAGVPDDDLAAIVDATSTVILEWIGAGRDG